MTLDIQSSGFNRVAGANGRELCGEFEYGKGPKGGPNAADKDRNKLPQQQCTTTTCGEREGGCAVQHNASAYRRWLQSLVTGKHV